MKSDNPLKQFAVVFVITLVIYAASYQWIEHKRRVHGPWQITFTTDPAGHPSLIINQPAFGITNSRVILIEETATLTNAPVSLTLKDPRQTPIDVPFGKLKYMDLTFLPGTLTFELHGHEIELIPRTLYLNRKETPWTPNTDHHLKTSEKLPAAALTPRKKKQPLGTEK